ncbi:MAG: ribosome-associated translation inhibitor RaiA [Patescibacteria group bacterium]
MKITTAGKQLNLTEAMEQYVEKKLSSLEKFFDRIEKAVVTLGMETHHHQKGEIFYAECKMDVPGADLFGKKTAKDIYAAIDCLRDELESKLKKYKQKLRGNVKKSKSGGRNVKEYQPEE